MGQAVDSRDQQWFNFDAVVALRYPRNDHTGAMPLVEFEGTIGTAVLEGPNGTAG